MNRHRIAAFAGAVAICASTPAHQLLTPEDMRQLMPRTAPFLPTSADEHQQAYYELTTNGGTDGMCGHDTLHIDSRGEANCRASEEAAWGRVALLARDHYGLVARCVARDSSQSMFEYLRDRLGPDVRRAWRNYFAGRAVEEGNISGYRLRYIETEHYRPRWSHIADCSLRAVAAAEDAAPFQDWLHLLAAARDVEPFPANPLAHPHEPLDQETMERMFPVADELHRHLDRSLGYSEKGYAQDAECFARAIYDKLPPGALAMFAAAAVFTKDPERRALEMRTLAVLADAAAEQVNAAEQFRLCLEAALQRRRGPQSLFEEWLDLLIDTARGGSEPAAFGAEEYPLPQAP